MQCETVEVNETTLRFIIRLMEIVSNNHLQVFDKLLRNTKKSLFILVPFIKNDMAEHIASIVSENIEIKLITKIDFDSIANSASDVESIKTLRQNFSNISVRVANELHAKIYIFDGHKALITSANLTYSAFRQNFEYGVLINNEESIDLILNDFDNIFNNSETLEDFLKIDITLPNNKSKMDESEVINSISSLKNFTYKPLKRIKQKNGSVPTRRIKAIKIKDPDDSAFHNKFSKGIISGELDMSITNRFHVPNSILHLGDEIRFKANNKLDLNGKYRAIEIMYFQYDDEENKITYEIIKVSDTPFPGKGNVPLKNSSGQIYNQYYKAKGSLLKEDVLNNDFYWEKTGEWHSQYIQFVKIFEMRNKMLALFVAPEYNYKDVSYILSEGGSPPKQYRIMNIDDRNEIHWLNENQIIKEKLDTTKSSYS